MPEPELFVADIETIHGTEPFSSKPTKLLTLIEAMIEQGFILKSMKDIDENHFILTTNTSNIHFHRVNNSQEG